MDRSAYLPPLGPSRRLVFGLMAVTLGFLTSMPGGMAAQGQARFTVGVTLTDLPPVMESHETLRATHDREWHLISAPDGAAHDFILTE